jgi:hypothetical protein
MPPELIRAFGILKKACAMVNQDLGKLPSDGSPIIAKPGAPGLKEVETWASRSASAVVSTRNVMLPAHVREELGGRWGRLRTVMALVIPAWGLSRRNRRLSLADYR